MSTDSYRIVELKAENFKRLKAVSIRPDAAGVVQIVGRNEQGKSSVLDAIWSALAGKAAAPDEPIRRGEDVARIELDLGQIKVRRRFNRTETGDYTTAVVVESPDGTARFQKPQTLLDGLFGAIAFDPLSFVDRMSAADQYAMIGKIAGIDVAKDATADRADAEERKTVARDAKNLWSRIDAFGEIAVPESVDEGAIREKIEAQRQADLDRETALAARRNVHAEIERREVGRDRMKTRIAEVEAEIERLKAEVTRLTREWSDEGDSILRLRKAMAEAPKLPEAPADGMALMEELTNAVRVNGEVKAALAKRGEVEKLTGEAMALDRKVKAIETRIAKRREEREAKIAAAKLPIPGLGLGEGIVTIDGLPLSQASRSRQIKTSLAIGAALNPKLRVLLLHDGALLDSASMAVLAEFAAEKDMQVFVERVEDDGKVGIVIEDGEIRA